MASEYSYTGSQGYPSYAQTNDVWLHFEQNPQTNQAICRNCGIKIKTLKFGTSLLELHMKKYHSNKISQFNSNQHDLQEFRPYGNDYTIEGQQNYGDFNNDNDGNQWQSQYSYQTGNNVYNFDYDGPDNAYNSINYGQSYYEAQPSSYNYDMLPSRQLSNFSSAKANQIIQPGIQSQIRQKLQIKRKEKKISEPQAHKYQYQQSQLIIIPQDKNPKLVTKNNLIQQNVPKMQPEPKKPTTSQLDYSYPTYIDLKNRPIKLLQKIKKEGYFEDVYEPPTPINPKQSKHNTIVRQFFKNIDIGLNQQSVALLGKNKLNISQNQLSDAIESLWWGRKQLPEISTLFRQRGIHFRQSPDKQTMLVSEKGSLHDYLRYGECISIVSYSSLVSLEENVITLNHSYPSVYDAFVIMCYDWRAQFTFLALGLLNNKSQASVVTLLEMFFGCMHGFISDSIIINSMDTYPLQCFKDSIQMFCHQYGCNIKIYDNKIINEQRFAKEIKQLSQIEKVNQEMHKQISKQFAQFKFELKQALKQGNEDLDIGDLGQSTDINEIFEIRIQSNNTAKHNLQEYDPKGGSQQKIFAGLSNQIRQIQGLRRKMNWIIKPSQQKPIKFSQFISSVFRLNRYLKKISKESSIDFRTYYKKYKHPTMYKLYRVLGVKVFDLLEANYFYALKLQIDFISSTEAKIREIDKSNEYFKSISTYQLKFVMESNYWMCNCGRLYETGIPCRHLIAIILKFGGSLEYYIDSRWLPIKGDRQKLKKFRQKQPNDKE